MSKRIESNPTIGLSKREHCAGKKKERK